MTFVRLPALRATVFALLFTAVNTLWPLTFATVKVAFRWTDDIVISFLWVHLSVTPVILTYVVDVTYVGRDTPTSTRCLCYLL